jgi:hypothetical protein
MNPDNFLDRPYDSVLHKSEAETVARNIMVILSNSGGVFRLLTWDEYKAARILDGNFTESEKEYFDQVVGFCVSEHRAKAFCPSWGRPSS